MMYDYGNRLGTGLILSTHMKKLNQELTEQMKTFKAGKSTLMGRMKKTELKPMSRKLPWDSGSPKRSTAAMCATLAFQLSAISGHLLLYVQEQQRMRELFKNSKGFCLPHFRDLVEVGEKKLNDKQKEEFYPILFDLMEKNMKRLQEEVTWFCDKQDT